MRFVYKILLFVVITIYVLIITIYVLSVNPKAASYHPSTAFASKGFIGWTPEEKSVELSLNSNIYLTVEDIDIENKNNKIYATKIIEKNEAYNLIVQYSEIYGFDTNLALNIAYCESGFNRLAVSPTGAKGVYQFVKTTFDSTNRKMGREIGIVDVFNAEDNISAALWKLSHEGDGAWRPWSGHCYLNNPLKF